MNGHVKGNSNGPGGSSRRISRAASGDTQSSRHNVNGSPRGNGTPKRTDVRGKNVVAKMDARPSWTTIRVLLTEKDKSLPRSSRDLRIAIKKCKALGGFEHIPLDEAKRILDADYCGSEDFDEAKAKCTHVVDGFRGFYLRWRKHDDAMELLTNVLTDRVKKGLCQSIEETDKDNIPEIVIAPWLGDYCRAKVLPPTDNDNVEVQYVDHGMKNVVKLNELRKYPKELRGINPMAFLCSLDAFDEEKLKKMDKLSEDYFVYLVSGSDVKCKITAQNSKGCKVSLGIPLTPCKEWGILDVLEKEINSRMKESSSSSTSPASALLSLNEREVQGVIREHVTYDQQRRKVVVCSITSPSEFYLKLHAKEKSDEDLQRFYNSRGKSATHDLKGFPVVGRYYAWYNRHEHKWQRVKIAQYPVEGRPWGTARFWLIDEGRFDEGLSITMMKLDEKFLYQMRVYPAFLVHVEGLAEDTLEDGSVTRTWTAESIQFFKDFCEGKAFEALTIISQDSRETEQVANIHGVVLLETDPVTLGTVQNVMAAAGMCTPTGPAAGRRDLCSLTNKRLFDNEDSDEDSSKVNRQEARTSIVRSGSSSNDTPDVLLGKIYKNIGSVAISNCKSPDNFCIQMLHNREELDKMIDNLEAYVKKLRPLSTESIIPGHVYIAHALPGDEFQFWARLAIISIDTQNDTARALSIDYGHTVDIKLSEVYKLSENFEQIPPYCHRAHLDFSVRDEEGNILVPQDEMWTSLAQYVWRRYLICGDPERTSYYYAWQIRPAGQDSVVTLEEFDQPLRFDFDSLTWQATRRQKKKEYAALNKNRRNRMLTQFYSSIGINVIFEFKVTGKMEYSYIPLVSVLKSTKHVAPIECEDEEEGEDE